SSPAPSPFPPRRSSDLGGRVRRVARDQPGLSDEALAWRLVEEIALAASRLLLPVFERTEGHKGVLCVQVSPEHARDAERMIAHRSEEHTSELQSRENLV